MVAPKEIPSTLGWILFYSPELDTVAAILPVSLSFGRRQSFLGRGEFQLRGGFGVILFLEEKIQTSKTGKLSALVKATVGTGRVVRCAGGGL